MRFFNRRMEREQRGDVRASRSCAHLGLSSRRSTDERSARIALGDLAEHRFDHAAPPPLGRNRPGPCREHQAPALKVSSSVAVLLTAFGGETSPSVAASAGEAAGVSAGPPPRRRVLGGATRAASGAGARPGGREVERDEVPLGFDRGPRPSRHVAICLMSAPPGRRRRPGRFVRRWASVTMCTLSCKKFDHVAQELVWDARSAAPTPAGVCARRRVFVIRWNLRLSRRCAALIRSR